MTPGEFKYGDQVNFTDLEAVGFRIYINDANPPSPLASVAASFSRFGKVTQLLPCTVTNATNGSFNVDKVEAALFSLAHGAHDFTVVATFDDGSVIPYIYAPESVNIIQNSIIL